MDQAIADPASHHTEVELNQRDLERAGHWGVPTFEFNGEPFFGQDRIDTVRWRLDKEGLRHSLLRRMAPGITRRIARSASGRSL